MRRIVQGQIIRQNPPFLFQSVIQRRPRIGCQDVRCNRFYFMFHDPVQCGPERLSGIPVQPEYKTGIDHNPPLMNGFHSPFIFCYAVLHFVHGPDGIGADTFKTDKQALTTALLHQIQQRRITGRIDRNRCIPFQIHRPDGFQKCPGPSGISCKIIVYKHNMSGTDRPDILQYILDGPVQIAPLCRTVIAEITAIRTAPAGMNHIAVQIDVPVHQIIGR